MFKLALVLVTVAVISVVCSPVDRNDAANGVDVATSSNKSTTSEAQQELDKLLRDTKLDQMSKEELNKFVFKHDDASGFRYQDLLNIVRENKPNAVATIKKITLISKILSE